MTGRWKVILVSVGLAVIFAALVVGNTINYKNAEDYRKQIEENSAGASSPEVSSRLPPSSAMVGSDDESAVSAVSVPPEETGSSTEDSIVEAAETFVMVYYDMDTDRPQEEYTASFAGLLTEQGLQNFAPYLTRPSGSTSGIRLQRRVAACDVYVRTAGPDNATAFCVNYVQEIKSVEDNEPLVSYDPILLRLEMKYEDGAWHVNSRSFERSLATLPFNASEMFG